MEKLVTKAITKTTADVFDKAMDESLGLFGALFPYIGIKRKAVDLYIRDIEKSDLPSETKVYLVLNTKKTIKQIENQNDIVEIAINNAKEGTDFSKDSAVNREWLDRFMDAAGFVSTEEMQLIWGRILAKEFETPGSNPPNMIRILSEITHSLAKSFRIICGMSLWFLPLGEDGNIKGGYSEIMVPFLHNEDRFREMGVGFDELNELDTLSYQV